jgi:hypothetical protein
MVLLGLLIPLGVGVLAAMELRTPPRIAVAAVQPLAGTEAGISDSRGALAKADRLEIAYAKDETPGRPAPVDQRISASEAGTRTIKPQRQEPKSRKVAVAAVPKAKPKTIAIKRSTLPERSRAAGRTEPCRLSAFGGLRKALNLGGCEI